MPNKGPSVPPIVATGVLCLVIGGVVGFYAHDPKGSSASSGPPGMGGMKGGPNGAGGQGGQGGQAGGPPASLAELPRLVRNLDTVQKLQNRGLTAQQALEIVPSLKEILTTNVMPIEEFDAKLAAIEKTLTADQKQALTDLQPQQGGGGGRPGGGGPPPSGGVPTGGGMQDVQRPFSTGRNKQALEDLIKQLENKK